MIEATHPEATCQRCGGPNIPWHAPSPLWNAVMRPDGQASERWDIVCPICFAVLADEAGIARTFTLDTDRPLVRLANVSPDGRIWDPVIGLWTAPRQKPEPFGG